ncbi:MAG: hypothetical protein KAU50_01395, partial [Candidatus Marinimicrobia bacterium]|nr:hypothetical protein [Candidatus Neomarinimicrobiota bacterium]
SDDKKWIERLKVGDKLRILPNHSCLSAALFDEYVVVEGDQVIDRWQVQRARSWVTALTGEKQ